ncbi:MAG: hypothetical protein EOO12_12905 [Chitinophagaceae bacterium]|nr:MAG: hypothetical protein EOO12_12905 [Chitinophagaceae bacterium]
MDSELEMEAQLWAYIDGLADAGERSAIERHLADNEAWRAKYAELLDTHQLLHATELDEPSLRFTRNVMEAIAAGQVVPASRQYLNRRIVGGIAAFFGLMIAAVLIYAFAQGSGPDSASALPRLDLSLAFANQYVNAFLMLNILLGLFLLDRFLSARRRERLEGQS